jgi:hypothetical protein
VPISRVKEHEFLSRAAATAMILPVAHDLVLRILSPGVSPLIPS